MARSRGSRSRAGRTSSAPARWRRLSLPPPPRPAWSASSDCWPTRSSGSPERYRAASVVCLMGQALPARRGVSRRRTLPASAQRPETGPKRYSSSVRPSRRGWSCLSQWSVNLASTRRSRWRAWSGPGGRDVDLPGRVITGGRGWSEQSWRRGASHGSWIVPLLKMWALAVDTWSNRSIVLHLRKHRLA